MSGSEKRNNDATEKALHPQPANEGSSTEQAEDKPEEYEVVDQDPGERQKENQNNSKDDPLAA